MEVIREEEEDFIISCLNNLHHQVNYAMIAQLPQ